MIVCDDLIPSKPLNINERDYLYPESLKESNIH